MPPPYVTSRERRRVGPYRPACTRFLGSAREDWPVPCPIPLSEWAPGRNWSIEGERGFHGESTRPVVAEPGPAAGGADAYGAVEPLRGVRGTGQRARAACWKVKPTPSCSRGAMRFSSGPARAIRSTGCSSRRSPWSASRPSARSSSGTTTSSSSAARRSISAASPRWRPAKARPWSRPCRLILNALQGKGVHVVTVNDYLAQRDAEWMTPIYKLLGMSVGCIQTGQTDADPPRRLCLRHHLRHQQGVRLRLPARRAETAPAWRRRHRKTLRAGVPGPGRARRRRDARPAHPPLRDRRRGRQHPDRRGADPAHHRCQQPADAGRGRRLSTAPTSSPRPSSGPRTSSTTPPSARPSSTPRAAARSRPSAGHSSFVTLTVDGLYEYVERALRAQIAYLSDRDYVVFNGEIVIVDEFTGRMMPGRQWQDGLHQAIQAKERLEVTLETITAARVTVQDFFLRYKKLAGMTGTASSDAGRAAADLQGQRLQGADQPPRASGLGHRPRLLDRGREVSGRRRPDRRAGTERRCPS